MDDDSSEVKVLKLYDDVLTLEEAAEYLKISKAKLLTMVQNKEVPAKKFAEKWRFSKRKLLLWVEGDVG